MRTKMQSVLSGVALLCCSTAPVCAQDARFSASAGRNATLREAASERPRPSQLSTGTLLRSPATQVPIRVQDPGSEIVFQSNAWTLRFHRAPFGLELRNAKTGTAWRLAGPGMAWTNGEGVIVSTLQSIGRSQKTNGHWSIPFRAEGTAQGEGELDIYVLTEDTVRVEVHAPEALKPTHLYWNWQAEGPFFGLGERFSETKVDGVDATLRPEDLLGTSPGHNWTYIPVPLVYTPQGTGFYLDTGEVTRFDLRNAAQGRFTVQMDRASTDAYLFAGAGPKQVLQAYTTLTGTTPMSPPWAYGVWLCSYGAPEIVLGTAERLRKNHIPVSALWTFDAMGEGDVMGWPLWRTGYYPSLRTMTDKLHAMGFKSMTYVHPYLRSTLAPYNLPNPTYETARAKGLLVHDPAGVPTGPRFEATHDGNIDFTNPAALDWYRTKIRNILLTDGFDGWMEDYGEWINQTDQFSNGRTGHDLENLYSLLYHKATYTVAKEAKSDVVEFVRSGYAGSQGYTRVVWGGDQFPTWDADSGLPSVVNAGITAGLSGFAVWGPDIEQHGNSKELWSRWVEFGALTPIMRDHPWDNPNGAVNLWYDAETVERFRKYAGLHVSLFPYFYTYGKEAERTGLPIMRHLMLEYPADPRAADTHAEYLLGEHLLVAPVVAKGDTTRTLYLPAGEWIDYWTGESFPGGKNITIAAPVDRIPLLVRAGSILPFLDPETQTLATDLTGTNPEALRDLTWRFFPGAAPSHESFTNYDSVVATAETHEHTMQVRIRNAANSSHQQIAAMLPQKPSGVTLNDRALAEESSASASGGWRYDTSTHTLWVHPVAGNLDLTITR